MKNKLQLKFLAAALLFSLPFLVFCQSNTHNDIPTQTSDTLILVNANLVDVKAGRIREDVDIVIAGESIIEIGNDINRNQYEKALTIDLKGKYIIPGLIAGHAHVTPLPEKSLTFALKKGVVALRDMGGDGAYLNELKMAILAGELKGPDIYFSAVMGGRELIMKDSRVKLSTPPNYDLGEAPWIRLVEEKSDISQIVLDAKNCGATGIKLYAHLSNELVSKLTNEAKILGLKVWAHAVIYPATAEEIIEAGVEVVSHSCFFLLPPDWKFSDGSSAMDTCFFDSKRQTLLFETMKRNNVALDPTLVVTNQMLSSIKDADKVRALKESLYRSTGAAYDQGVKIVAGTDSPLPKQENERLALHEELELLVTEVGMSPMEAIRAATIGNAEMLGIDDSFGSIEMGKAANMVVLIGNPLESIRQIEEVYFVIKNGKLIN